MISRIFRSAFAVAIVIASACASDGGSQIGLHSKVEFRDASGEVSFALEPNRSSARVLGADGALLASLHLRDPGISISDARGRPLGTVRPIGAGEGFRISTHESDTLVLELRTEPDGDLSLLTSDGGRIYQLKRRDYGFKIVGADGKLHTKIRSRPSKTSVRDAAGNTYLWTRDTVPASSVAVLALDEVRFEYASALFVALLHWGDSVD